MYIMKCRYDYLVFTNYIVFVRNGSYQTDKRHNSQIFISIKRQKKTDRTQCHEAMDGQKYACTGLRVSVYSIYGKTAKKKKKKFFLNF